MKLGQLIAATIALVKAGATAGTTTTYTTTAAVVAMIAGVFASSFGTKTNQATPTTDGRTGAAFPVVAKNKGTVLVWGFTADATVKLLQGSIENLDVATGGFKTYPQFPEVPDTIVPFAYTLIQNGDTGSNWTAGASNWDATGITDTWVDIGVLPARPVGA